MMGCDVNAMCRSRLVLTFVALVLGQFGVAAATEPLASYHVGNSLTWDSRVTYFPKMSASVGITHDVGHHIRCSKGLPYIVANPTGTCVDPTAFGKWQDGLPGYAWDVVTMQIHPSDDSNLQSDTLAAAALIDAAQTHPANAQTRFILFGAWPPTHWDYADNWLEPIDETDLTTPTGHQDQYQRALFDQVRTIRPDANVELIQTGKQLYLADQAIKAEVANGGDWFGLTDVDQLYRDTTHLNDTGRWLATLAMWAATTGQDPAGLVPPSYWGPASTMQTDLALRDGLSGFVSDNMSQIHITPEPTSLLLFGLAGAMLGRRR